ncbi:hypothetical protein H0A36_17635 [Endozoicomonas sp. SM1973]|uniref:Uncharacterized protein n=1 Tax=Spartinivicinus marinus TaxID=2994442 RepID=A0A853I560_9GAMM|nr:hypothetical protein [Spartinivicinus marinus]MCX4030196.1 hypothetical protein [Spartinivicinus marinus]NYZ67839.1 hypothetical protein [Spartinivicinus marinus]
MYLVCQDEFYRGKHWEYEFEDLSDALTMYHEIFLSPGDIKQLIEVEQPHEVPVFYVGSKRVEGWDKARQLEKSRNAGAVFSHMVTRYKVHTLLNKEKNELYKKSSRMSWSRRLYLIKWVLKGHLPAELFC